MKWVALVLLVVQNTALVLLMRYSLSKSDDHYIMTTAVASMESSRTFGDYWAKLKKEVFFNPVELFMLAVPSVLYTLQNNLLYVALANLDAATYQVCYQLKILTTAIFSILLLKRQISITRWLSLVLLTIGVSLAQFDASSGRKKAAVAQNPMLGFVCVLMASVTSGFAGVWFEKILKGSKATMWMRNIQMGITSIAIAFLGVYTKDRQEVLAKGFFYGYNGQVISIIVLQAIGGLVVAAVVKYADNILKGFGSSISIVISCVLEFLFFDFHPTFKFILGSLLVNYSMYVYSADRLMA